MKRKTLQIYFTVIYYMHVFFGAMPENIELKSKFRTYLLNRVWPVAIWFVWAPLHLMLSVKLVQLMAQGDWHRFLDVFHVHILATHAFYKCFSAHRTAKSVKFCIDAIQNHFVVYDRLGWRRFVASYSVVLTVFNSFAFYIGTTAHYGDVLVPIWIPFVKDEEQLSAKALNWVYSLLADVAMYLLYAVVSPCVVVITSVVIYELDFLIEKCKTFVYSEAPERLLALNSPVTDVPENYLNNKCFSESSATQFVREFVQHHLIVISVINEVKKIHDYSFLTEVLFTVLHSCFIVFDIYYTNDLTKALVKSSPLLVVSYYLLFIYCWNGQRLSDKCDELYRALYRGRWYSSPKSFKTSLLIIMQVCQRPVRLTGGRVFVASFKTFLTGVEQSVSYVLILKQLSRGNKTN